MATPSLIAKCVKFSLVAAAASAVSAPVAFNAVAEEVANANVERIQVTGSRIQRTDLENATPVTVLSADDMAKQGFTNVQDALESLTATTSAMTGQEVHGFTPAASSISLRGAGANRTLTLINGKRLNQYPKPAGGTNNFVDTSNIPMDAVARIEVLNSGASAIYGADAVGGVVNIILKRDFEGVSLKYRHADTQHGGGGSDRVSLSIGSTGDRGNVSTFLEFTDTAQLRAVDRENFGLHTDKVPHSQYSSYSSYGARIAGLNGAQGYSLDEQTCTDRGFLFLENGICGWDRSKQRDLAPESRRFTSTTSFNYELSDDVLFVGRMDFGEARSITRIESMADDGFDVNVNGNSVTISSVIAGELVTKTYNDKNQALGGDFANLADGDYYYVRRLHEFGNRTTDTKTQNYFFSGGFEGDISDFHWDASANYGKTSLDVQNGGFATQQGVWNHITQGDWGKSYLENFTKDEVAAASYSPFEKADSSLLNVQANLTGTMFEVPAGYVDFAFGAEWSRQDYSSDSDSESKKGTIISTGGSSGQGSRDFWATYLEMIIPVTDTLELNAAARYDRYSDFGGNFTPQLAAEYRPIDDLLVRASVGGIFRAPDMHRVYGDPTAGFNTVVDVKTCVENGGEPGVPNNDDFLDRVCNELHIDVTTGANKDLNPEKGYTANLGVVYSGRKWNASVDLWQWKLDDMVSSISANTAATNPDIYEHMITRDPVTGEIIHINSVAQNLAFQKTTGVDFEAGYGWDLGGLGDLNLHSNGTYFIKSESQANPTNPIVDDYEEGGLPRYRVNANLTWLVADFETTLAGRHISGMKGIQNTSIPGEVPSHTTWNLTSAYNITDSAKLTAGVVNMFDKGPNFDPTYTSWPHYPRHVYNARGREFFVEAEVKF
ncbi:TonB-dependent receptor [Paraferrimonas haliotis]|uniref:TonB-dependent receptor n=1 Tax=Paraferrimonas haliotis TaxID=2013866 RepID=A0AA37TT11_9GAMM|nr:TonB-dependent receptor [Paraferrimonas haliotis]GLS83881.1 TonB-dependent receptor [Paraferrimonas haliotis]GLS84008.1 TonB-dependent receptor [Paraferrimonas haliotis]